MAKALGMYKSTLLSVVAGKCINLTAVCTVKGDLFTFGDGHYGKLAMGHGGTETELVPRLDEALAGKSVVSVSAEVINTQQCGPRRGSSSPLGMEAMAGWATEGHRMSMCRDLWRRWQ